MTGTRPLSRNQVLENRAFLRALRKTGSANAAARETGCKRTTMERRRDVHPAFKLQWDAALVIADGALHRRTLQHGTAHDRDEPRIIRGRTGKLQLRRARRLQLTREVRQRFLLAVSASANITLSAAAAGFSHHAFYQLRKRDPAFAREWQAALEQGYARLEETALAGALPQNHEHDAWRHNEEPALPTMTANQMLQLLYLHQKSVVLASDPFAIKRKRGEPREVYHYRLTVMAEARLQRERDKFDEAEAARRAARLPPSVHDLPIGLPQLDQVRPKRHAASAAGPETAQARPGAREARPSDVTARASPAPSAPWSDRALFGGFRAEHLTPEQRARAQAARR